MEKNNLKDGQLLIEQLEIITGKKVLFEEDYRELDNDIQKAAKILASLIGEDYKVKAKNLARKHNIRQEAVEALLKKDLVTIINSKF